MSWPANARKTIPVPWHFDIGNLSGNSIPETYLTFTWHFEEYDTGHLPGTSVHVRAGCQCEDARNTTSTAQNLDKDRSFPTCKPLTHQDRNGGGSHRTGRSGTELNQSRVTSNLHQKGPQHLTFIQVAAELPRAYLNDMSWNPATVHQPVPMGNQHLVIEDSLTRNLTEIHVMGQTTAISCGGASVAQVIRMREIQKVGRVQALVFMIGANFFSRKPFTPKQKGNRC